MTTFATLFSGGELAGVGMRAAGLTHRWGIELSPAIAAVAQANGFNVLVADVLDVDPSTLEPVDCLHASPVCTRASSANQSAELNEDGTKEAPLDIAMGEKVARFIDVLQPRIVTIENVYAYRNFKAFKIICAALDRGGYFWDFDNLNAADYGVPQTRRRLILRAVRGSLLPNLPQPERWIGWYEAIGDLIPTLPESKFAAWQLERLPILSETMLIDKQHAQPAGTPNRTLRMVRTDEPSFPVVVERVENTRAFIIDGQDAGSPGKHGEPDLTVRQEGEPMFTVSASMWPKRPARAWLVSSVDSTTRRDDEPSITVVAVGDGHSVPPRAYLFGDTPEQAERLEESERAARNKPARAWLRQGRVVALTPRALARLQSVPDSYRLPEKNGLACKIIGNGVPCLMMEKIYQGLIG